MSSSERRLSETGSAAPPRSNGELVFAEPWESRAFGLAVSLSEQGAFEWQEFRTRLIEEIAAWERAHPGCDRDDEEWSYYRCWLGALERLLAEKGICAQQELETRTEAFRARPHGHDH